MEKQSIGELLKNILVPLAFIAFGVLFIFFSWGGMELTYDNFYKYIYKNGIPFIFSLFFIGVGIYCWTFVFSKDKEDILYLKNYEDNDCIFIDKKGKVYRYYPKDFEVGSFYKVLRRNSQLVQVIEKTDKKFEILKPKESFWLNMYTPFGNFKNIMLLPIIYVVALPGFLSFIMSKGFQKIFGIIFMAVPIFLIVYDIVYKIKKNKISNKIEQIKDKNIKDEELSNIDESEELLEMKTKSLNIGTLFYNGFQIFVGCVLVIFLLWVFLKGADTITKIIILPFLICGCAALAQIIFRTLNMTKYVLLMNKLYIVGFLLYWFGFLCVWIFYGIKSKEYWMLIFSIPFLIAGIFVAYNNLFKKKK